MHHSAIVSTGITLWSLVLFSLCIVPVMCFTEDITQHRPLLQGELTVFRFGKGRQGGGGESRVEARLRRGQKICFYTHYCVMSSLYFCMKLLLNKFGCGNPSVNDIALPVFPLIFLHCSRAVANTAEAEIVVRDEFSLGL